MRVTQIVVDSDHPAAPARFWAEALDGYAVRPYDEAEIARLAEQGFTPETHPVVMVDGPGLQLCFQQRDASRDGGNDIHLDMETSRRADQAIRLLSLGATVVYTSDGHTWMADPEGNNFCVVDDDS